MAVIAWIGRSLVAQSVLGGAVIGIVVYLMIPANKDAG